MSVLTNWIKDYRKANKCEINEAMAAWRMLPDDNPYKQNYLRESALEAAAPDMLAALIAAEELLTNLGNEIEQAGKDCPAFYSYDFLPGVRNKIITAIQAAKGKQ